MASTSSNNSGFSNAEFDKLIADAAGAKSISDGVKAYQQAEDIVVREIPVIPMWFGKVTAVYGEGVDKFVYNNISGVSYGEITLKK